MKKTAVGISLCLVFCFAQFAWAGQSGSPDAVAGAAVTAEALPPGAAVETAEEKTEPGGYAGTWLALLPPLLAIVLALLVKEVYSSLFLGTLLGCLLVTRFHVMDAMTLLVHDGLVSAISSTAGIFVFLVILGILTQMVAATGASDAFGQWAQKHVKSRVGAILVTFALGILIFIDDYFNCLTVGNVMIPVTDVKRISRAKLAYLVDSTAAPICMIAPMSSWAAAVSQYAEGTGCNGLELFVRAIPFNFYSLLTLVFILAITFLKFDYGPMACRERTALEEGNLGKNAVDEGDFHAVKTAGECAWDMLFLIGCLIVISVLILLYIGYRAGGHGMMECFRNTEADVALPLAGVLALLLSVLYLMIRKVMNPREIMACVPKGIAAMVPAMLILTLAVALKNITDMLELNRFIAGGLNAAAPQLRQFLPMVIFLVACGLSFASGASWATFGILIPIVVGCFPPENGECSPMLFISISACLAGSVCGDHCSPIADTTIMSSAGAHCNHIEHVSTQLPYAMTVAGFSVVGFLLAGFSQNWYMVFPLTAGLMLGGLWIVRRFAGYRIVAR